MAQDVQEALARAKTLEPDVALVDIGMPGMDGHELARRLRAQPRHRDLVLVAVTGYGRAEDRDAAHRAGFDAYLVKPADTTELANLIAGARGGRMQGND